MKKQRGLPLIFLLAIFLHSQIVFAHTRSYVFNEEYRTIPQGQFEIESWARLKVPNRQKSNIHTWEWQEEFEYGVTDHFTFANYQVWETKNKRGPDDSTVYKGFKFEGKYRIGEKDKYWVDPLIYFEWVKEVREANENEFESKLILSKDFGGFNITFNEVMENTLGSGGRTNHQFTLGSSYQLPWDFKVGVEGKGDWWRAGSHRNRISFGPVLAWEGKYVWVASGVLFGFNRSADDFEARLIVGIPLPFDITSFFKPAESPKAA